MGLAGTAKRVGQITCGKEAERGGGVGVGGEEGG